jgi:hypothetical protein
MILALQNYGNMDLSGLQSDTYGAGGFKNMWRMGDDILILEREA